MGSLMPSGAWVRCSRVAVFISVLMVAVSYLVLNPGCLPSGQRDELRKSFLRLAASVACFRHFCNLDLLQHFFDALIHLAQGLANRAALGLVALAAHRDAGSDEQWPINGPYHFIGGNLVCGPSQGIASIDPVLGVQQTGLGEPLQNLGQNLRRNPIRLRYVLGTASSVMRMLSQMLHSHQPVVGLLRSEERRVG